MKTASILLALFCTTASAFATDLKCHGRAEPSEMETNNAYAQDLNYKVTNNAKDGFTVSASSDDKSTSDSSSGLKAKEWKEAGMTVIGVPAVQKVYLHDRYHAMLAEKRGGYDNVPEYTRYVALICE